MFYRRDGLVGRRCLVILELGMVRFDITKLEKDKSANV